MEHCPQLDPVQCEGPGVENFSRSVPKSPRDTLNPFPLCLLDAHDDTATWDVWVLELQGRGRVPRTVRTVLKA